MAERAKLEAGIDKKITMQKTGGNFIRPRCMSRI